MLLGVNGTPVMKKNKVPIEFDKFCFSMVTKNRYRFVISNIKTKLILKRSLDLQAGDIKTRIKWVKYLKHYLVEKRDKNYAVYIFNIFNH